MKKSDIVNTIKDIENQFESYKDGGRAFIDYLAKRILNTVDEEKNEVFKFFLNEIKTNENGFCEIALLTIDEMGALELAPGIESIYNEMKHIKDDRWKHSVVETLMKLRYSKPKLLYAEYVSSYIKKQPDGAFFLLVQYCNVDPEKALPLLSEFYVEYLFKNTEMQGFLESRIGFLVSYFLKNLNDYLPDLVKQTLAKNKKVGLHLKSLIVNHLNSGWYKGYSKVLIKDRIENLNKLNL